MQRRTLLKGLGGVSLAGAIAGCLGDLEDDEDPENPEDDDDNGDTDDDEEVGQPVEPEITSTSIESGQAEGNDDDGYSVSKEDLTIRIDGRITAPTPCHEAAIESADYEDEELSVTVGTEDTSDPDEACQQVITQLSYNATIEFVGEAPETDAVSVTHRGAGDGGAVDTDDGYDY